MLVQVTKDHIKRGHRKTSGNCPVALAIRELGYEYVVVGSMTCTYAKAYHLPSQGGDLPSEVTRFIERFDNGVSVEPITFVFEGR